MRPLIATIIAACVIASGAAQAQSGESVVKSKGCVACHAGTVGPAFKEIAARYRGDQGAEARLIGKLKEARNHPKVGASDAELKSAIQYVLKQ
ncbi:MAG: hypothetical protein WBM28_09020 [Burkholderiales bacterium]